MKTELNLVMNANTTFDQINGIMAKYQLSGGYGYNESILSREDNHLVLRCHLKDRRMKFRDILSKLDELALEEAFRITKATIEDE